MPDDQQMHSHFSLLTIEKTDTDLATCEHVYPLRTGFFNNTNLILTKKQYNYLLKNKLIKMSCRKIKWWQCGFWGITFTLPFVASCHPEWPLSARANWRKLHSLPWQSYYSCSPPQPQCPHHQLLQTAARAGDNLSLYLHSFGSAERQGFNEKLWCNTWFDYMKFRWGWGWDKFKTSNTMGYSKISQ